MGSTADELLRRAETLRRRILLEELSIPSLAEVDVVHLFDRLQLARDEFQQLHNTIKSQAENSVRLSDDADVAVLQETDLSLKAEFKVEDYLKWSGIPPDRSLVIELLKKFVKDCLACHREEIIRRQQKMANLQEEIDKWNMVVYQEKQLIESFKSEIQLQREAKELESFSGHLRKAREKFQDAKSQKERLVQQLKSFLEEQFPPPDKEMLESYSATHSYLLPDPVYRLKTLADIVEVLLQQILTNRNDPWVPIDETFWPPYLEFLVRCGIVAYHWDNSNIVRLDNV